MPLYTYTKKLPDPPVPATLPKKLVIHPLPIITSLVGLMMIASVVWPVFSYEISSNQSEVQTTPSGLLTPLVDLNSSVLAASTAPKVVGDTDFTHASNWFVTTTPTAVVNNKIPTYSLSIPKLRIDNAIVQVDSDDLTKGLVHYPGTSLPGDFGSPVIFGHSILPQFYNPKNYMSIFSLLPTLNPGDQIDVTADGVSYTYTVSTKYEVYPTDLSPLEQRYDTKQLKLITCVPPGLKTKRLVVVADLQKI